MDQEPQITVHSSDSPVRHPVALLRSIFADIWRVRGLTWMLFVRDLKAQYRESLMGYVWLLIPPVTTAAVWFFLNSQKIIQIETEVPYPIFVLIGTTVWTSFTAVLGQPLNGFNAGRPVFMKLNVPAEAFVFSVILRALFETVIRVLLFVPLFVGFQFMPPLTALWFPLALFGYMLMAVAIGLLLVPVGSLYGDVMNALNTFIRLFMYSAPVLYPIPEGNGLLAQVMRYNPLTPGVALTRDLLTNGSTEWAIPTLIYSLISIVVILVALVLLRVALPHLVARMGM